MNNDELKEALFSKCPVEYRGVVYSHVSAIIYKNKKGKLKISAELMDKNKNSVTIAIPSWVKEVKQ